MASMLFTENKKRKQAHSDVQDPTTSDKKSHKKRDQKKTGGVASWATSVNSDGVVPAWSDSSVEKLRVNIEDTSRLRKLKKEEGETHVSGDVYMQRL